MDIAVNHAFALRVKLPFKLVSEHIVRAIQTIWIV